MRHSAFLSFSLCAVVIAVIPRAVAQEPGPQTLPNQPPTASPALEQAEVVPAVELEEALAELEATQAELEATHARNYQTLNGVLNQVPDSAKPAIQAAMQNSARGWQKAKAAREQAAARKAAKNREARGPSQGGQFRGQRQSGQGQNGQFRGQGQRGQGQGGQGQRGQGQGGQFRGGQGQGEPSSPSQGGGRGRNR